MLSNMLKRSLPLLCLAAILACGCSGGSTSASSTGGASGTGGGKKQLTIGFAQEGAESAWRTAETKSVQDEATKRGIDLKFVDAQGKQENQIKALHSFIEQKVDGIILAPKVETGWDEVLKEAQDAHIPVVLVDRGITTSNDSLYATLIASDFVQEGQRAGQYLADHMNGKGNIAELQGTAGAAPAIDRHKGFMDVLAKYPNMKIIISQDGDFNRAKGKEVMEAFLKSQGKNINAVYAHNDDMALGALQAIQEAGLKPGKDILLVSIDGTHDGLAALANGDMNCVVECNPLLGPAAFDAIQGAIDGKPLPKKTVVTDQQFDQASAQKALPSRQY